MLLKSYYVDLQKQKEYDNIYTYSIENTRNKTLFLGGITMKKIGILLGIFCVMTLPLTATALDDAAIALSRGEISEENLRNNFSKVDFESIMERFKRMKLQKAKQEAEKEKVNSLLKQRNEELQEEIRKIKDSNSKKKSKLTKISLDEAVKNTFKGIYGDNPERIERLKELGFNIQEIKKIQQKVNELVQKEKSKE